jgi:putative ABC transport system permease protein
MFRLIDTLLFSLERLWQQRWLVIWALLGLIFATTLALALPLYSDAVNTTLLNARLDTVPYAFRFRYLGAWKGNIGAQDVTAATATTTGAFPQRVNLPTAAKVEYVRTGAYRVTLERNKKPLSPLSLGTLTGLNQAMTIAAGSWPPSPDALAALKPADPLPALVPEGLLYQMGVQVGDTLTVQPTGGNPIRVRVQGEWRASNTNDPIWNFYPPKAFDSVILLPADLFDQATGTLNKPIEEAAWYVVFNGLGIRTADIGPLLDRITDAQRLVDAALPGIRTEISPVDGLVKFNDDARQLTIQLAVLVLPVAGLVLYFVSLVAGLLVNRQTQEDVTLRSRGMSRMGVLGIHAMMWIVLAGIALAIGVALSPYLVQLVGRTSSFLRFDNPTGPLDIVFTSTALGFGALTGLLAASTGLYAAWRSTASTITSFKTLSARAQQAWWQRVYLDILILIPAYYVLYSLIARKGLSADAANPFADPLPFLGPTLFVLGNTLLFLRLWPLFMRIGAWWFAQGRGISALMALRELTRSISRYRGSLLMMAFTLALTGFTASMASTLDRNLRDQVDYSVGADLVLVTAADVNSTTGTPDATTGQSTETVTGYNVLPIDDLLKINGVAAASRVGRYDMQIMFPRAPVKGTLLGIDRATMAEVTKFRSDYASLQLADLFNQLAGNRTGVIISEKLALDNNLKINQEITYQVFAFNQWRQQDKVPIIGIVRYFPTLDPRTQPFIITNLDPVFELATTYLQYDVWMALKPGTDPEKVVAAAQGLGYPVVTAKSTTETLQVAQSAPARRGVLGFLSVGFVASILLTLVGNIVQSAASFRAQAVQLGTLRAMGLSGTSVAEYLVLSQGLAVLSGVAGGTLIGAATTLLFLPLLDFSGGLPPYQVRVSWTDIATVYAVFAGVLIFATLVMTFLLGRQRLASMVKLGEAA